MEFIRDNLVFLACMEKDFKTGGKNSTELHGKVDVNCDNLASIPLHKTTKEKDDNPLIAEDRVSYFRHIREREVFILDEAIEREILKTEKRLHEHKELDNKEEIPKVFIDSNSSQIDYTAFADEADFLEINLDDTESVTTPLDSDTCSEGLDSNLEDRRRQITSFSEADVLVLAQNILPESCVQPVQLEIQENAKNLSSRLWLWFCKHVFCCCSGKSDLN